MSHSVGDKNSINSDDDSIVVLSDFFNRLNSKHSSSSSSHSSSSTGLKVTLTIVFNIDGSHLHNDCFADSLYTAVFPDASLQVMMSFWKPFIGQNARKAAELAVQLNELLLDQQALNPRRHQSSSDTSSHGQQVIADDESSIESNSDEIYDELVNDMIRNVILPSMAIEITRLFDSGMPEAIVNHSQVLLEHAKYLLMSGYLDKLKAFKRVNRLQFVSDLPVHLNGMAEFTIKVMREVLAPNLSSLEEFVVVGRKAGQQVDSVETVAFGMR